MDRVVLFDFTNSIISHTSKARNHMTEIKTKLLGFHMYVKGAIAMKYIKRKLLSLHLETKEWEGNIRIISNKVEEEYHSYEDKEQSRFRERSGTDNIFSLK